MKWWRRRIIWNRDLTTPEGYEIVLNDRYHRKHMYAHFRLYILRFR